MALGGVINGVNLDLSRPSADLRASMDEEQQPATVRPTYRKRPLGSAPLKTSLLPYMGLLLLLHTMSWRRERGHLLLLRSAATAFF